jgi:hypothetical protein
MKRLAPTLKLVDGFSALAVLCLSANTELMALIWGSIQLTLALGSAAHDTLQNVVVMLEELSTTLPRYRASETLATLAAANESLEAALWDVYTEVVCFFARAIHFFRMKRHVVLRRSSWDDFSHEYRRVLQQIKHLSAIVENEVGHAQMRANGSRFAEALCLVESLKKDSAGAADDKNNKVNECCFLPVVGTPKFWSRDDALQAVEACLKPESPPRSLLSFTLFGMGGVGKSEIAVQYARKHLQHYNAIFWVRADTDLSLRQSCLDIARKLRLSGGDDQASGDAATTVTTVRSWLMETRGSP